MTAGAGSIKKECLVRAAEKIICCRKGLGKFFPGEKDFFSDGQGGRVCRQGTPLMSPSPSHCSSPASKSVVSGSKVFYPFRCGNQKDGPCIAAMVLWPDMLCLCVLSFGVLPLSWLHAVMKNILYRLTGICRQGLRLPYVRTELGRIFFMMTRKRGGRESRRVRLQGQTPS